MTRNVVHRPGRTNPPERPLPDDTITGPQPVDPAMDQGSGPNLLMIVPMVAAAASMLTMMAFRQSPFAAVGALTMVVTLTAMLFLYASQSGKERRRRTTLQDTYTRYLDRTRRRLIEEDDHARHLAHSASPPPSALIDVVRSADRLWERRRTDEDFLWARIGVGARSIRSLRVAVQDSATQVQNEFMLHQAEALVQRFGTTDGMPVTIPLDSLGNIAVVGSRDFGLTVARSLLLSACTQQAPEDLVVALIVPREHRADWDWFDRLPHARVMDPSSPTHDRVLVAEDVDGLMRMLRPDLNRRSSIAAETLRSAARSGRAALELSRLVIVVDSCGSRAPGLPLEDSYLPLTARGITLVTLVDDRLNEPSDVRLRIIETGEKDVAGRAGFRLDDARADTGRPDVSHGHLDAFDAPTALGLATVLSPLRLSVDSLEHAEDRRTSTQTFLQMLGLSPELTLEELRYQWRPREQHEFLRVPIGEDDRGDPVHLDLKEAAQLGMGPHGLCVGATGSGKSELLRAFVFALLASHAPERMSMLLIDFKGGATFAPFHGAPHVVGIITNLSDDLSLVERVYASLSGEILRRQEVLKSAGNLANITDYQAYRERETAQGRSVEPLPHLIVIIDEFGELLTARPDFINLFLSIGRIGRSIGVHLLLSSQRIESGKLRGLETYLSYRLGLRTLSESESRTVLDTPDAFHLPPLPGFGYLKVDTSVYSRFRSGYVSSPLEDEVEERERQERSHTVVQEVAPVLPMPAYGPELSEPVEEEVPELTIGVQTAPERSDGPPPPTIMESLMHRLREVPSPVEPLWLPPLPEVLTLDQTVGEVTETDHGLRLATSAPLQVPIGLTDDPERQWQGLWTLDFTAGSGHLIVQGGPRTGKTTLLQTIVSSLALTHTPQQVGVYCVDVLGAGLLPLQGLPHVGGVAIRTNKEMVIRTLRELSGMLTLRERLFEAEGIDSMTTLRRRHADGSLPSLASADIFLVLDGYGLINEEFSELTPVLNGLIGRGAGYGIHVVTTVSRQNEIRAAQQSYFSHRVELHLPTPSDSAIDRKVAEKVRGNTPGRGISTAGLHGQVALPRIDGVADATTAAEGLTALAYRVAASVRGRAMAVRVLPAEALRPPLETLEHPERLPLGLLEDDLSVRSLAIDGRERHLLAFGDAQTGRSSMLRQLAQHLCQTHTDTEMMAVVFDPRGELKGAIPDNYVAGYAGNATIAVNLARALVAELEKRQSPDSADNSPMRKARIAVFIDDYDVLTVGGDSPLTPLLPFCQCLRS
ncbi:MAG: type VII secretion protein EccCa [Kocuria sp.]|nr:type VII secretion protein EccCa [Kocuria sp.]